MARKFTATDAAAREEKMAAVMTTLEQGIEQVLTSEGYAAYLATLAKFHSYSFGNTMLIMLTKPEATRVAGFQTWKSLGRSVRKGEKGIAIMVPHKSKVGEDDNGESVYALRGFGIGHVFDISQTEGEDLPPHPATSETLSGQHEATDAIISALTNYVAEQGAAIVETTDGPRGYWMPAPRQIGLRADIDGIGRAKTLAHEVAHMIADHRGSDNRDDAEDVAESAAYVVMSHFGIDTSDYSFGYVAGWAKDMQVVKRNLADVQRIAHQIIDAIAA